MANLVFIPVQSFVMNLQYIYRRTVTKLDRKKEDFNHE